MSAKDIWIGLRKLSDEMVPPAAVLRNYAESLTQSTEGLLQGTVDISKKFVFGDDVQVMFRVTVPALGGYEVNLLSIDHNIHMYPAVISSSWSGMTELPVNDQAELMNAIERQLSSDGVQKILASLISQARAA